MFDKFQYWKQKPYWRDHIWTWGYCADTIGFYEEKMRKYFKYQATKEREVE